MHLKVRKKNGERVRKKLLEMDGVEQDTEIQVNSSFIYFPLKKEVDIKDTEVVEIKPGKKKVMRPRSLQESLRDKLTGEELRKVPRSFDVVGDIAVLEIPGELRDKKEVIGNSLINTFRNIRVVAVKKTGVRTEYRTRLVEVVAGEKRTGTVHREHGCIYRVDIQSTYFSPRLSAERLRVAEQVGEGERVLVMFAGVGPYAILIAKHRNPSGVYAIEMNPAAAGYMKENAGINKVAVTVIEGDVKKETPGLGGFDRIIMPLPKDAGDFLDVALPALKKRGVIHFYDFSSNEEESVRRVREISRNLGYGIEILDAVKCGSYSPSIYRICVDFTVLNKE